MHLLQAIRAAEFAVLILYTFTQSSVGLTSKYAKGYNIKSFLKHPFN